MRKFFTEGVSEAEYFRNFYMLFLEECINVWCVSGSRGEDGLRVRRFDRNEPLNRLCDRRLVRGVNPPRLLLECMRQHQFTGAYVVVDDDVYVRYKKVDGQTKSAYQEAVEESNNEVLWQENNFEDFIAMHLSDKKWRLWCDWLDVIRYEYHGNVNGKQMKAALNALVEADAIDWDDVYVRYQYRHPEGNAGTYAKWFQNDSNLRIYFIYGLVRCWYRTRVSDGLAKDFGWMNKLEDLVIQNHLFTQEDFKSVVEALEVAEKTRTGFFYGDKKHSSEEFRRILKRWCNASA